MNPEEGELRPQLIDRFGLCVQVEGEMDPKKRVEIIRRRGSFDEDPLQFLDLWAEEQEKISQKIIVARQLLPEVKMARDLEEMASWICIRAMVAGHRGDLVMVACARTIAAFSGRKEVTEADVLEAAEYVLPHRLRDSSQPNEPQSPEPREDEESQPERSERGDMTKGRDLLRRSHTVVYAGSLVNTALLDETPLGCQLFDSATMTLEEVLTRLSEAERPDRIVVRLHSGDPSLYGAIREQMDALNLMGLPYAIVPGVSSFSAAAAALEIEYTLPGVSQTVILSRMQGRTPVPERESIGSLASHNATMVLFLSTGMLTELCAELMKGGYPPDTPGALVYKASWPDECIIRGTISSLPHLAKEAGITSTALVIVGNCLGDNYQLSRLYAADFSHGFRQAP